MLLGPSTTSSSYSLKPVPHLDAIEAQCLFAQHACGCAPMLLLAGKSHPGLSRSLSLPQKFHFFTFIAAPDFYFILLEHQHSTYSPFPLIFYYLCEFETPFLSLARRLWPGCQFFTLIMNCAAGLCSHKSTQEAAAQGDRDLKDLLLLVHRQASGLAAPLLVCSMRPPK